MPRCCALGVAGPGYALSARCFLLAACKALAQHSKGASTARLPSISARTAAEISTNAAHHRCRRDEHSCGSLAAPRDAIEAAHAPPGRPLRRPGHAAQRGHRGAQTRVLRRHRRQLPRRRGATPPRRDGQRVRADQGRAFMSDGACTCCRTSRRSCTSLAAAVHPHAGSPRRERGVVQLIRHRQRRCSMQVRRTRTRPGAVALRPRAAPRRARQHRQS